MRLESIFRPRRSEEQNPCWELSRYLSSAHVRCWGSRVRYRPDEFSTTEHQLTDLHLVECREKYRDHFAYRPPSSLELFERRPVLDWCRAQIRFPFWFGWG